MEERAYEEARKVREHAYAPYSGFKVGAALVSSATAAVYSGCNVENASYGATICAERNAVLHAVAEEGRLSIALLAVVSDDSPAAPPCAMCLQVLSEFCSPDTQVILGDLDGITERYTFSQLLPYPFDGKKLQR